MNIDKQLSESDLTRILTQPGRTDRDPARMDADLSDIQAVKAADEAVNIAELKERPTESPKPRIKILKFIDFQPNQKS